MKKIVKALGLMVVVVQLTACFGTNTKGTTFRTEDLLIKVVNDIQNLTKKRVYFKQVLPVGSYKQYLSCRLLNRISAPNKARGRHGNTFTGHINDLFRSAFRGAKRYSSKSRIVLSPKMTLLKASSNGKWNLGIQIVSSNGKTLNVKYSHSFKSSFLGDLACPRTENAFHAAAARFIEKVVNDPSFKSLVR